MVDSNHELWGMEYQGITIEKPSAALQYKYDLIIMTVNDENGMAIFRDLTSKYNVPAEKIISHRETIVLSKDEIYNIGNMEFDAVDFTGKILTGKEFGNIIKANSLNDLEKFYFTEKHKCINKWMHYFEAYDRFFSRFRGKNIKILEIGVFRGGSLQMWKKYFHTADNRVEVYGIDIDPECKSYEEDDIHIFIGSQEDREFLQKVKKSIGTVDILIDDGGHTMNQQIVSFEELFDLVADDGIYLCEDLHTSYMGYYGGGYKADTYIEYSKNLIDYLHFQYWEKENSEENAYADRIKFITYCDSMVFIEKKSRTTKSICVCV